MNDDIWGFGNRYSQIVDVKDLWSSSDTITKLRNLVAQHAADEMDIQVLQAIKDGLKEKPETEEDKVIRILKGDFEKTFGITFDRFQEVYSEILDNSPEKLI